MTPLPSEDWTDEPESRGAYGPGEGLVRRLTRPQMKDARLIVDVRIGDRWRQHLSAPFAAALAAARAAEVVRRAPGVAEVSLCLEVRDASGRYARHPLFRADGHEGPLSEHASLAGFSESQWELFMGSWLERSADDNDAEDDVSVDFTRFPFRALIGSREMQTATIALSVPAIALIVAIGLQLNLLEQAVAASLAHVKPPPALIETLAEADSTPFRR
jgi:hypothetical protein